MRHHGAWAAVSAALLAWCAPARAANAAFSADGGAVYVVTALPNALGRLDVERCLLVNVDVGLGKDDVVAGLARAKEGALFLVTKSALWSWTPGEVKAKWLCLAPEKVAFDDVACNPKTGEVLITSGEKLFCKRNRRSGLIPVSIRYQPGPVIDAPVYLQDGSFLFSSNGDLWHGYVEHPAEEDDSADSKKRANLVAYRYAPLAARETYDGTPAQSGVRNIAVGREKIYVEFSRMGGSGWGVLLRLNIPVQETGAWTSHNGVKDMARTVGSVEELGTTSGGYVYLCGAADGQCVYYGDGYYDGTHRGPRHFWIMSDGKIMSARTGHDAKK